MAESAMTAQAGGTGESRRDFLYLTAGAMGAVAVGAVAWPIIDSMNPSADVLALASTEVDLSPIEEGQRITVTWRGKPIFIDNRERCGADQGGTGELAGARRGLHASGLRTARSAYR
jgi:ubiquinol-cytochrome c reductase iron-sulfur subunit